MTAIRSEIRRLTRQASPPFHCSVAVESVTGVSSGFRRVVVTGDGLADYRDVLPADAFKIFIPPDGTGKVDFPERNADGMPYWPEGTREPVLRAYTVRWFDPAELRLAFDVLTHDGGVAMAWLRQVSTGDVIGLAGMRREFTAGDGVDRHLIAGDSSALPAVAAIVESLPPGTPATVYLAVSHDDDRALVPVRDDVTIRWVRTESLEREVRAHEQAGGRIQAWLGAEAEVVRGLRRFVTGELNVARDDLHAGAYWRSGMNSTDVDAVYLERYGREIASGAEVGDPDTRERVELDA